jgi:hypothetical protein
VTGSTLARDNDGTAATARQLCLHNSSASAIASASALQVRCGSCVALGVYEPQRCVLRGRVTARRSTGHIARVVELLSCECEYPSTPLGVRFTTLPADGTVIAVSHGSGVERKRKRETVVPEAT